MKLLPYISLFLIVTVPCVFATEIQDLRGDAAYAALSQYEAKIKQNPNNFDALKSAGIILHQLNRSHAVQEQINKAENYLKRAIAIQSQDLESQAWLGSVITMKALFESNPGKKTFFVKMGTRMLDKAVKRAPDNTVVRLTRAYNSMELPVFLMRTKFAVEDFKHYLNLCKTQSCPENYVADAKASLTKAKKIIADNF